MSILRSMTKREERIQKEFETAINSYIEHGYDLKNLPAFLTGWFGSKNGNFRIVIKKDSMSPERMQDKISMRHYLNSRINGKEDVHHDERQN